MIVDDEPYITRLIARALEMHPYDVYQANSGHRALEQIRTTPVDVLISDIQMPDMDGVELIENVHCINPDIPVIVITGQGHLDTAIESMRHGAVDYLQKPLDFRLLELSIKSASEKLQLRRKLLKTHEELRAEITESRRMERALQQARNELEQRVEERTTELAVANKKLKLEIEERKQVEQALRESERRYREVVEGTNDLIARFDRNGRIIFVNRTAEQVFGVRADECIGLSIFDFVHPEDLDRTRQAFDEWRERRLESISFENRQINRHYKERTMLWNINLRYDKQGRFESFNAIARDMTETKQAKEALVQSEKTLRVLIEATGDSVLLIELDGTIRSINTSGAAIYQMHPREMIDRNIFDFMPSNIATARKEQLKKATVHKTPVHITEVKDERIYDDRYYPIMDRQGEVTGFAVYARDITERQRTEETLKESELKYRTLFESVADSIFLICAETGAIRDVNSFACRTYGYNHDEWLTLKLSDIQAPLPNNENQVYGADSMHPIHYHRKRDGTIFPVEVTVSSFTLKDNNLMIYSARDYTERKKAEQTLGEYTRQIRQDAETKATLLQEVNHRVKNNLAAIMGMLYAEQQRMGDHVPLTYQEIINNLSNRIYGLSMVHNMLSSSGWAPIALSELTGQMIQAALRTIPADKHITVNVPVSDIMVTPKQANILTLIINELATNTIKHALKERQEATIRVAFDREKEIILFDYRDDGPGYPDEAIRDEQDNLGMNLIHDFVYHDLRGSMKIENNQGAVTLIRFKYEAYREIATEQKNNESNPWLKPMEPHDHIKAWSNKKKP